MSEPKDTPLSLLRELLDKAKVYDSEIEENDLYLTQEWVRRAQDMIDQPSAFTREHVMMLREEDDGYEGAMARLADIIEQHNEQMIWKETGTPVTLTVVPDSWPGPVEAPEKS